MKWHYKFFLSFLLVTATITGWSQKIPPAPNPPKQVNDLAGVLSATEVEQLEAHLLSYNDTTSNQVAVVLINTLDGYPIEEYATRLYREWGIGNKKTNNGVLILAAIKDHKIRIEVGYGLEGAIPDITANRIIEEDIVPDFRNEDYYEGLKAAADHIIDAAKGEYKGTPNRRRSPSRGGLPIGLIIFVIIMIIVFSGRNRGGGGGFMSRRGSGWLGPLILGSMLGRGSSGGWGGGGGGGWSGGGGGFGGFGGGSSGGGGASGSW